MVSRPSTKDKFEAVKRMLGGEEASVIASKLDVPQLIVQRWYTPVRSPQ